MLGFKLRVSAIHVNVQDHLSQVRSNEFWTFAATEWHRLYSPWVPMRTGMLANTVTITPGQIEHTTPYAIYQYNGRFNFRRDQHLNNRVGGDFYEIDPTYPTYVSWILDEGASVTSVRIAPRWRFY